MSSSELFFIALLGKKKNLALGQVPFKKSLFFIYTFQDRDNELSFHHLWFVFQFERR